MDKIFKYLLVFLFVWLAGPDQRAVFACDDLVECLRDDELVKLSDKWRVRAGAPNDNLEQFLSEGVWIDTEFPDSWKETGFPASFFETTYHRELNSSEPVENVYLSPGYAHSSIRIWFRSDRDTFQKIFESIDEDGFNRKISGRQITEFVTLPPFTGVADLIVQVSNSKYENGGIRKAPTLGTLEVLSLRQRYEWLIGALMAGAYLMLAIYNVVFWRADRARIEYLGMSLGTITMVVRQLDTGRLLAAFAPDTSVDLNWMIGWSTFFIVNVAWSWVFLCLLREKHHRYLLLPFMAINAFGLIVLWGGGDLVAVKYGKLLRPLLIPLSLYCMLFLVKRISSNLHERRTLLFGIIFVLITVIFDVSLYELNVEFMEKRTSEFGFLVFVFCLTLDIGRQYSKALKQVRVLAEELLQTNAELENQVEERTKELSKANKRLEYLAQTDDLTGIANRRSFSQRLEEETKRQERYGNLVSLAILDIDHFKMVNDTYGHDFGDEVLKEVTAFVTARLRNTDFAARYGGEEFAIILPETSLTQAQNLLDRIRSELAQYKFMIKGQSITVTVSVGLAASTQEMTSDGFFKQADLALYEAKNAGRNRVSVA